MMKDKLYQIHFFNYSDKNKYRKERYSGNTLFSVADNPEDYADRAYNAQNKYYPNDNYWKKL